MSSFPRIRAALVTGILSALGLVAACTDVGTAPGAPEPSHGAIRVAPSAAAYAPGSRVELVVVNDTTLYAHGDHCARGLELEVRPNTWGRLASYDDALCSVFSSLFVVGPGENRMALAEIPAGAPRGRYRTYHEFVLSGTQMRGEGARVVRHSEPFTVR